MKIIYAREPITQPLGMSIFLAGPTPRIQRVSSWRPEAIKLLESHGFKGTVLVPEDRGGVFKGDYIDQVDWEHEGLDKASVILFWIPRQLTDMPGFTTNVEFGLYASSGRVVLGAPTDAPKMRYLRYVADKLSISHFESLDETIERAIKLAE